MRLTLPWAATIAAILLTSQAAIAGTLFPKVLVGVAPLKPYVDEILRGAGESQALLRPGQDPHDFALSPSQAKALDEADILIVPDLGMNPVLQRLLAKKTKLKVIELSALAGAEPLPYAEENPWLVAMKEKNAGPHAHDVEEEEHHHGAPAKTPPNDPHLWLDPERMAAMAEPLAIAISASAEEARPALTANARALAKHLRQDVTPALRAMLAKDARLTDATGTSTLPFITYHAAYQYFLGRFGLAHYGEVTQKPEAMMGAKSASSLIASAEGQRVRCLIGEQRTVLMERIAKATGAKIVILSPEQLVRREDVDALDWLKNDYDRFLYLTVKRFAECL